MNPDIRKREEQLVDDVRQTLEARRLAQARRVLAWTWIAMSSVGLAWFVWSATEDSLLAKAAILVSGLLVGHAGVRTYRLGRQQHLQ